MGFLALWHKHTYTTHAMGRLDYYYWGNQKKGTKQFQEMFNFHHTIQTQNWNWVHFIPIPMHIIRRHKFNIQFSRIFFSLPRDWCWQFIIFFLLKNTKYNWCETPPCNSVVCLLKIWIFKGKISEKNDKIRRTRECSTQNGGYWIALTLICDQIKKESIFDRGLWYMWMEFSCLLVLVGQKKISNTFWRHDKWQEYQSRKMNWMGLSLRFCVWTATSMSIRCNLFSTILGMVWARMCCAQSIFFLPLNGYLKCVDKLFWKNRIHSYLTADECGGFE